MSDDEHDQFDFDEDADMRRIASVSTPWFLQEPWTYIAGFVLVGSVLALAGNYFNTVNIKKPAPRARR